MIDYFVKVNNLMLCKYEDESNRKGEEWVFWFICLNSI